VPGLGDQWWSEVLAMVHVKSRRSEGGGVPAAVSASGGKAVVLCRLWHCTNLVGVHRASLGCVLLSVVGCGSTGWIGGE